MKKFISNNSRVLNFKAPLSLSVIPNNSGFLIHSSCSRLPVWTLCAVDSRGSSAKPDPFSCIAVRRVMIRVLGLKFRIFRVRC